MERKKLLLLHGALGSRRQMDELAFVLSDEFEPVCLNLPGHGGRPIREAYTMEHFTEDLKSKLCNMEGKPLDIFGYSMGGYVALLMAMKYPELVGRIMTLGTKFDWTPQSAERECLRLDPDKMTEKVPAFVDVLSARHSPQDWRKVVTMTRDLLLRLGNGEAHVMSAFHLLHQVLILRGSLDHMVRRDESEFIANQLSKGRYDEILNFRHPLEQTDVHVLSDRIRSYFGADSRL